jgi:hypothetical protein
MKKALVIIFLALLMLTALGCGEPKQKEVTSSGKTKQQPKEELLLEKVGFVPQDPTSTDYYIVVGKMTNNSLTFACENATAIISLYNASNIILGTQNTSLSTIYPNSYRWLVSDQIAVNGQVPARAEIKIKTAGSWKKTSSKPPFQVIQKNYLPGESESKITGVFKYTGKPLSPKAVIKATGVLLNANGDPVGAGTKETGNITTAGEYPFEISLYGVFPGVADTDVQVFDTGQVYLSP